MSFKNQKEIYEALLAGKKIRDKDWKKGAYVWLVDGMVMSNHGSTASFEFTILGDWELYEEQPEPKRLYAYTGVCDGIKFFPNELKVVGANFERAPEYDIIYPVEE